MKIFKWALPLIAVAAILATPVLAAECVCLSCADIEISCAMDCQVNGYEDGELQYCENNIYGCAWNHGACICTNEAEEVESPWGNDYSYE
jgi:hypothetical protein